MNKKDSALIMANARRLIKANKRTVNWVLYSELFGTGSSTAFSRCLKLGLNPDSNETNYTKMIKYITTP